MGDVYERVLLVKNEVFVFKIPPLTTTGGYKAADWDLQNPNWVGRLRLVAVGDQLEIRLEDKNTGNLYAKAPVAASTGVDFEQVSDSSRYFVIRLRNDNGQTAFVGIGFADRSDSFDLNVAIQDHFKMKQKEADIEKDEASRPKLDLKLKEGQTITVSIGKMASQHSDRPRAPAGGDNNVIPLLPPPPSASNRRRQ
uniref:NECAP PHear domain-containing protein n=1 Tax=Panagrolaimus sp. JU765 TaxID=591449 RepID=A0AC34QR74_9BILA